MCNPAIIPLAAAVIGAGTAVYTADQQRQAQHEAQDKAAAAGTAQTSTNANTADANSTSGPAASGVNSGQASTLLTGPGGVNSGSLNLGAGSTLLGSNTLLGS
jgi:uncharacterized protein HemX